MLTNKDMTFNEMGCRFGEIAAYGYLEQIERAAGISPAGMVGEDPEMRLTNAYRIQDAMRNPVVRELAMMMAA